jgi:hypothetical protein
VRSCRAAWSVSRRLEKSLGESAVRRLFLMVLASFRWPRRLDIIHLHAIIPLIARSKDNRLAFHGGAGESCRFLWIMRLSDLSCFFVEVLYLDRETRCTFRKRSSDGCHMTSLSG